MLKYHLQYLPMAASPKQPALHAFISTTINLFQDWTVLRSYTPNSSFWVYKQYVYILVARRDG